MKKKLVTKYRLARVLNTVAVDSERFTLTLADNSAHNYGPMYRDEEEFDTHQEALDHAMNSEKWLNTQFTVLPMYFVTEI